MAPPPRGCMTARADWQQWNVPMRFTAMMRSHSSGVLSMNGLMTSMPALFTRIDNDPTSASVVATAASTLARSAMSMPMPSNVCAVFLGGARRGVDRAGLVEVTHHHRGAGLGERRDHCGTDAASAAGDQCDLSGQAHDTSSSAQ